MEDIDKALIFISIILMVGLFYYIVLSPEVDYREIANKVCKDINKTMTDRKVVSHETSNTTKHSHIVTEYMVECEDEIISYEPIRIKYWKTTDCDTRDKWGECKNIFLRRIKVLDYNK